MRLQLKPPAPKLAIRLIKSNPARRYCTKRRTVRVFPSYTYYPTVAEYVAMFDSLNNLIP